MALVTRNFSTVADSWWAHLIRGIAAFVVGVFVIISPDVATTTLAILIGCWLIADGAVNIVSSLVNKEKKDDKRPSWVPITIGSLSAISGILLFFFQKFALPLSLVVIGVWATVIGAYSIILAIILRRHIRGETTLPITGVISLGLGIFMILSAVFSWVNDARVMGIFVVIAGLLLVMVALRLLQLRAVIKTYVADVATKRAHEAVDRARQAADRAMEAREAVSKARAEEEAAARMKEATAIAQAETAAARSLTAEEEQLAAIEADKNIPKPHV